MENIIKSKNRTEISNARNIKVAAVQMESAAGNKALNLEKIESFIVKAARKNVQIIVFPECCITGYWFIRNLNPHEIDELSESIPGGESTGKIAALSVKYGMTIGAGLIEKSADGFYYNSYLVAMPDGKLRWHRKLQAFEHALIKSGNEFTVFDTTHGVRVGVLICYDNNVNENGRITALMGAKIVLAPHQTGGCRTKNPHLMGNIDRNLWENRHINPLAIENEFKGEKGRGWLMRWLPSRAHDNGVFLVFANGVGVDDDEIRTGNAMILDPYGRILCETWKADDDIVIADLDLSLAEGATGREWIAARRPDLYGMLTVRTGMERDTHELKFEE